MLENISKHDIIRYLRKQPWWEQVVHTPSRWINMNNKDVIDRGSDSVLHDIAKTESCHIDAIVEDILYINMSALRHMGYNHVGN